VHLHLLGPWPRLSGCQTTLCMRNRQPPVVPIGSSSLRYPSRLQRHAAGLVISRHDSSSSTPHYWDVLAELHRLAGATIWLSARLPFPKASIRVTHSCRATIRPGACLPVSSAFRPRAVRCAGRGARHSARGSGECGNEQMKHRPQGFRRAAPRTHLPAEEESRPLFVILTTAASWYLAQEFWVSSLCPRRVFLGGDRLDLIPHGDQGSRQAWRQCWSALLFDCPRRTGRPASPVPPTADAPLGTPRPPRYTAFRPETVSTGGVRDPDCVSIRDTEAKAGSRLLCAPCWGPQSTLCRVEPELEIARVMICEDRAVVHARPQPDGHAERLEKVELGGIDEEAEVAASDWSARVRRFSRHFAFGGIVRRIRRPACGRSRGAAPAASGAVMQEGGSMDSGQGGS
jgi:hypothetical protein